LPTPLAMSGYALLIGEGTASGVVLFFAYRKGKRESRGALLGHLALVACAANDILSVTGVIGTPTLLPYSFLIYGFGVADTLLVRYRASAEELEKTANELRQATNELTNSYLELSRVQEELFHKKQLASVGELAASIAHEVRNPLAIIVNAAASLKRHGLGTDDRNTLFVIIEEETTRLNNLVTELLRFARPMNVRREDVPLAEIYKVLARNLDDKYALRANVGDAEADTVWADAGLFRLALQNIVDNACQSMPEGGTISVQAFVDSSAEQRGVRIGVSDNGPGMDAHTLSRAMDPFFSTRPSGTGLGLPIAERICEAHGGSIDVRSEPGAGTTVTLFMPNKRADQRDSRLGDLRS
jgi:signal transduction histidine kinase